MCRLLFETVRWTNGEPLALGWHQRRVEYSLLACGAAGAAPDLAAVLGTEPGPGGSGVYKCHMTYDTLGRIRSIDYAPYRPRMIRSLICVDAAGLDYSLKWEDRTELQALGGGLAPMDEALILRDGYVTDTRYGNVVFGHDGAWVTPETYLLPGTRRARLLAEGVIRAVPLTTADLPLFRYCSLINAMLAPGDVVVRTEDIVLPVRA